MALVLLDRVGGGNDPTEVKLLDSVNLGLRKQNSVIGGGLSAGVDQLQSLGYSILGGTADIASRGGIPGAATARDWANEEARVNQIDAGLNGRPDLENIEDQTLGSAIPYVGYQIAKQVPLMAGIAGAQLIPGVGQAAGALGLTRLGAVAPRFLGGGGLQAGASVAARRAALAQGEALATGTMAGSALGFGSLYGESVEGGDPSPWKALALSPIYGAAEAVLPAVLQGGLRLPSRYSGNLATRMAKAGGVAGSGEALTELGQNELEMSMRSDLTDEQKFSRRLNSAASGFIVGGGLGTVGGFKGQPSAPTGLDTQQIDLMSGKSQDQLAGPKANQLLQLDNGRIINVDQADQKDVGLQKLVNQNTGVTREKRKNYEAQFKAAFDEPSGQYVTDPATGIERQLSVGEYQQLNGDPLDLTQAKPADNAAASKVITKLERDPRSYELRDTFGVIPTPSALQLYAEIQESGIPAESDILIDVWKYAGEKPLTPKRFEKAQQLLDAAIIKARQGAPNVSAPISTGSGTAGSVAVGGANQQGGVATAGPVSSSAGIVGGAPVATGTTLQQTSTVPNTTGQSVAPVVTNPPVDLTVPAAPEGKFRRAPKPMTVLEAANAAKATQAQQTETQKPQAPADTGPVVDERIAVMQKIFGDRNGEILFDVVGMGMSENDAAEKYNLTRSAIQKIAGATGADTRAARIANAKSEGRVTDAEIASAFNLASPDTIESQVQTEIFNQSADDMDVNEAIEGGLGNIVNTAGAGTSAVKGFTKLQIEIDATLEALAAETDKTKLKELNAKLEEQITKLRAVEAKHKAYIRDTAGTDTSTKVDDDVVTTTDTGDENAVPVESTTGAPVQSKTKAGKGVGKQVRSTKKPAAAQQTETLTDAEKAAKAWDAVASGYPTAPKFADLTKAQQQNFIDFGPDNWTKEDVNTELTKLAKSGMQFGIDGAVKKPYTAKQLTAEIKNFIRSDILGRKLIIVDSVADLLMSSDKNFQTVGAILQLEGAYGVATPTGQAFLIANRITQGQGRAKFMHEVGAHLGLENLLSKPTYDKLTQQILNWAKGDESTIESVLAVRAAARVLAAGTVQEQKRSELLAYFLEEATLMGIDPTAAGKQSAPLRLWFSTLWNAFKAAITKLGFKSETLTAQDVINLAFGAAKLEMSDEKSKPNAATSQFGFGGIEATSAKTLEKKTALVQAQLDIANGVDPETVWKETGWYKGTDKKWRFEFDDSQAKLKQDFKDLESFTQFKLSEVLDHPALFKEYPELKDVTFEKRKVMFDFWGSTQGWFNVKDNKIVVTPVATDPLSTILHEIQHWIQARENFENGSNPNGSDLSNKSALTKLRKQAQLAIDGYDLSEQDNKTRRERNERYKNNFGLFVEMARAKDVIVAIDALLEKADDLAPMYSKAHALDAEVTRFETAKDILEKKFKEENKILSVMSLVKAVSIKRAARYAEQMQEIRFYSNKIADTRIYQNAAHKELKAEIQKLIGNRDMGHELYRLVAGEVEARNVQSRKDLPAESRQQMFPEYSMDVQPENTLTSTGRGGAYLNQKRPARFEGLPDQNDPVIDTKVNPGNSNIDKAIRLLTRAAKEKDVAAADAMRAEAQKLFDNAASGMRFGKNAPTQGMVQRNISKLPKAAQQPARNSILAMNDAMGKGLDYLVFTSDLVNRATAGGMSSAKKFVDLIGQSKTEARANEMVVEKIADMYALVPEKDRGTKDGSVNRFLFDSTREAKWGYGKYRDETMGARFDKLSAESQAYVEAVFTHGSTVLAQKKKMVLDSTTSEYDAMIAVAKADGDAKSESNLLNEKKATLKRFQTLFKIRDGMPYAPIKRNGSHVVIAKSQEYMDAEAAKDTKKITELESNGDHYHVSFTDGKWEARTLQQELIDQGSFADVQFAERDNVIDEMFSGHSALRELTKMRSKVDEQVNNGDKTAGRMLKLISQMYLEALAEGSARKSEMRRRGVDGEVDMIRSFAQQGRADANFMASVKYNPKVQDALQEMRTQAKTGDRGRKSEIFNELAKRYLQSLEYTPRPWLGKLTRMSSLYYLATSPAYYLQNLTQPWMMSVPAIAGKHDYLKASGALFKAYTQLGGVMKSAKLLKQQFDFDQVPSDVRDAIKELVNRGKIDIGLDTEMGEFKVEGDTYVAQKISNVDKALRLAVQKVESINRLSTAMAAYRLELIDNKGNKQDAIDYADRILTETHGDYTSFNAPRAFNTGLGKVALQFRKFQLIQLSFYAKLINDSLTGADRAAARKTLAYSLGHTALLAGTMGLPGYAAIAWLIGAALGSDDEPYDLTREIRKAIGDEQVANLVLRGAPTLIGADLSGKIGAGNMLSIQPFSQADLSTNSGRAEYAGTLFLGAAGGMTSRMIDGLGLMLSGDYQRGLEQTMPKGVSDAMKAYRIANDGMTRRNGDIILPPDEVSTMDALFQAIGVQPVKQAVAYERQTDMKETVQNFTDRTIKIKNDYVKAARKGDTEAQGKAREAWTNLQAAKQRNGVKSSPLSELMKAPSEQAKRERMTVGGVQYKANTRQLAEELARE